MVLLDIFVIDGLPSSQLRGLGSSRMTLAEGARRAPLRGKHRTPD